MITPLREEHLDAVAAIESQDGDVGWSRTNFERELEHEIARFFVIMEGEPGQIAGYGGYWKAGPEAQITNLVIREGWRCKGLGRRLVEFMLDCARGEACESCTLEVRASNAHAQSLYNSLGFEVKGKRVALYKNPVDDALLMEKIL